MFLRLSSSVLALSLLSAPATFALTPDELWTSWTTYFGSMGYDIAEGSRDASGDALTLNDVVLTQASDGGKVVVTMPKITMTANGDSSVTTTWADKAAIRFEGENDDEKPVAVDMTFAAPGLQIVTTGDVDNRTDRTSVASATLSVDKVDLPDEQPDLMDVGKIVLTGVTGETTISGGKQYSSTSAIENLEYTINVAQPDSTVTGKGSIASIEGSGEATLPSTGTLDMAGNFGAAIKNGAAFDGTLKLGEQTGSFQISGKDEEGTAHDGSVEIGAAGGQLSFSMAAAGLGYSGAVSGLSAMMSGMQFPTPVSYKIDDASFDVQLPVSKSDTPAPFKFAYSLGGVTVADALWDMIDPDKKLSRVPANLDIDITGLVRLNTDLLDELDEGDDTEEAIDAAVPAPPATDGAAEQSAGADTDGGVEDDTMPFDPIEMTINQFAIDAVGAKVTAQGALKAPEGGSLSEPVGTISAKMEGINGLIDTLTAMGVVPADQVQGYRMMLAMFTKAGEGPDTMVSDIEFKEGGQIFANGQQIK